MKYDSAMMAVALDNLLDNALRHTRLKLDAIPNGQARVNIRLQHIDNKAVISVDDMGRGIPQSERKKIFKRFGRTSRDPATGATGLGLGLALVKEIVEGHKGSVRVEDSRLGGARFVIELRVA